MNVATAYVVKSSSLSFQMVQLWDLVWTCKHVDNQRSPTLAWLYCAIVNIYYDVYEDLCDSWPKGHLYCVVRGGNVKWMDVFLDLRGSWKLWICRIIRLQLFVRFILSFDFFFSIFWGECFLDFIAVRSMILWELFIKKNKYGQGN